MNIYKIFPYKIILKFIMHFFRTVKFANNLDDLISRVSNTKPLICPNESIRWRTFN